jgi:acylphosphatase
MHTNLATLTAFVTGYVQGVGFRYFVSVQARRLGLVGWTRNLKDGRVEVVVRGSHEAVNELLTQLHYGPREAEVERVQTDWTERDDLPERFEVRR